MLINMYKHSSINLSILDMENVFFLRNFFKCFYIFFIIFFRLRKGYRTFNETSSASFLARCSNTFAHLLEKIAFQRNCVLQSFLSRDEDEKRMNSRAESLKRENEIWLFSRSFFDPQKSVLQDVR